MNRVLSGLMAALVLATTMAGPVPTNPQPPPKSASKANLPPRKAKSSQAESKPYQIGIASWYGKQFHGKTTANGEDYDMFELTAAHRELPLGSYVKVTNLRNGEWIIVRINDRGPYVDGRILDLSYGAARMLNFYNGIEPVRIDLLHPQAVAMAQSH
jgi:rare lipoprotein A